MFQARPTDERYVTGGGGFGPVWHFVDKGEGGQNWRYVIVERPLTEIDRLPLRPVCRIGQDRVGIYMRGRKVWRLPCMGNRASVVCPASDQSRYHDSLVSKPTEHPNAAPIEDTYRRSPVGQPEPHYSNRDDCGWMNAPAPLMFLLWVNVWPALADGYCRSRCWCCYINII